MVPPSGRLVFYENVFTLPPQESRCCFTLLTLVGFLQAVLSALCASSLTLLYVITKTRYLYYPPLGLTKYDGFKVHSNHMHYNSLRLTLYERASLYDHRGHL